MKNLYLRRFLPALLSLALLLSLTACGGKDDTDEKDGEKSNAGALLGDKDSTDPAAVDPEQAAASLAWLRECLAYSDEITGAVAYLGQREQRDRSTMADWLNENCGDLVSELPFLLDIPDDLILGAGYGKLYCIVTREISMSGSSGATNTSTGWAYSSR